MLNLFGIISRGMIACLTFVVGSEQVTLPATRPAPIVLEVSGPRQASFNMLEEFLSAQPATTLLKGVVADLDSKQLSGSSVEVNQSNDSSFGPRFFKPPETTTYRTDQGRFAINIDLQKHIGAEIIAREDGYYDRRIYIAGGPSRGERDAPLQNAYERKYIDFDPSSGNGLTIHLQKKGHLTILKAVFPTEATVQIDRYGELVVVDPNILTLQVALKGKAAQSPKPGLYCLKAAREGDRFILGRREELTYIRPAHDVPLGLQLTANDPTIEFQWADPADPSCPALSLTEAPAGGYVPSLDITPDRFDAYWSNPEEWFYCKSGSEFGRGHISDIDLSHNEQRIRVRFQIWLQPDGSRNLETGQER